MTCVFCENPATLPDINDVITRKKTHSEVAKKWKTSTSKLSAHMKEHMSIALRPAMRRIMADPDTNKALAAARAEAAIVLVDKLAALSDRLDVVLLQPYHPKTESAIASLAKALKEFLHELGIWTGDIKENLQIIHVHAQYIEFKQVVLNVLADHPEVLAEVEAKLQEQEVETGVER